MSDGIVYREEVESLHEFFVRWFTGVARSSDFDRVDRALAPGFQLVTPRGIVRDRDDVLEGINDAAGGYESGTFDIEIRNVEVRERSDDVALVRYEEWQDANATRTGRFSTAFFGASPTAPNGIVWRDLHETWIDGAAPDDG